MIVIKKKEKKSKPFYTNIIFDGYALYLSIFVNV